MSLLTLLLIVLILSLLFGVWGYPRWGYPSGFPFGALIVLLLLVWLLGGLR